MPNASRKQVMKDATKGKLTPQAQTWKKISLSLPHSPKTYERALAQLTRLLEEQEDLKCWGEIECLSWELYNAFAYTNMNDKGTFVPPSFQEENQSCIDERRQEYALIINEDT